VAAGLSTASLRNMSSSSSESEKFDPSRRRLCPDGACVGLLDESGRCKECGLTASGKVEPVAAEAGGDELDSADLDFDQDHDHQEPAAEATGGFDPKRKLCPDGSCVGVIGADGRCSVCGQAG
jgi:hypothetical protein